MAKSVAFGFIWAVVFYFLGCVGVGAVAGAMAGMEDPQNASTLGAQAGAAAVAAYRLTIFLAAVMAAIIGAYCELLPGTKRPRTTPIESEEA